MDIKQIIVCTSTSLMEEAPSEVDESQLDDLGISIRR